MSCLEFFASRRRGEVCGRPCSSFLLHHSSLSCPSTLFCRTEKRKPFGLEYCFIASRLGGVRRHTARTRPQSESAAASSGFMVLLRPRIHHGIDGGSLRGIFHQRCASQMANNPTAPSEGNASSLLFPCQVLPTAFPLARHEGLGSSVKLLYGVSPGSLVRLN